MAENKAESKYINLLTDYGFKKVFGDKEIMMAFLTDLLEPKSPIADITFLDKELGADSEYDRGVVYDLLCQSEDGSEFIVEMQNRNQSYFSDRILFYLSRSYSEQAEKGNQEWEFRLKPVYGIFFLNFHLKDFVPMPVRTVQLKVNETGEVFSDKLKVFTLELPEYRKLTQEDCKTKIDYWLYNLTNLETMTTPIPFQTQQPIFSKVGNIAELVHMTPEERRQYNISIDSYRTNLSVLKNERAEGREEGRAEGREEGRAEGHEEGVMEVARKLKSMGLPTDQIIQATGLSADEIQGL